MYKRQLEGRARGEIEHRARRRDIFLDHHDPPRAVKHAQGEWTLLASDLVVIQLHGVDGAAAEPVVLRVGAENGGQQDAGLGTFGMGGHFRSLETSSPLL